MLKKVLNFVVLYVSWGKLVNCLEFQYYFFLKQDIISYFGGGFEDEII